MKGQRKRQGKDEDFEEKLRRKKNQTKRKYVRNLWKNRVIGKTWSFECLKIFHKR